MYFSIITLNQLVKPVWHARRMRRGPTIGNGNLRAVDLEGRSQAPQGIPAETLPASTNIRFTHPLREEGEFWGRQTSASPTIGANGVIRSLLKVEAHHPQKRLSVMMQGQDFIIY